MKMTKYIIGALAALVMPLTSAHAADYLFNNSSNNTVGGSPATLSAAPGGQVTISLQVFLPAGFSTSAVDYWFIQFSGPTSNAFSIVGRDYAGSSFSDPSATNLAVTSAGDSFNNSTGAPSADGVADNLLSPRNGPDLGSTTADNSTRTDGTFQIATFTFQLGLNAAPGTYELRTFDYPGFGINDITPTRQAAININVVPEPATWSLVALGGLSCAGLYVLRRRRGEVN